MLLGIGTVGERDITGDGDGSGMRDIAGDGVATVGSAPVGSGERDIAGGDGIGWGW